ncbi:MAG: porin [Burkholderiales bacterium]|nr:porin [Burkholderiales bacterium]MDE2398801.1 porin [Burkholderiales bacterium]MDE2452955.1 porin [Burkholderiales bacterium]
MKKSLLALAVLGAFAGAASAQSSVTVFGLVDQSINRIDNGGETVTQVKSNQLASNRLGFRGTEDLGGGLNAGFWIEAGMDNQNGGGASNGALAFNRRSTVSLSGAFGEIRIGHDYTPQFWAPVVGDVNGANGLGNGLNIVDTNLGSNAATFVRANNQVEYFLPGGLGGLYGEVGISAGQNEAGNKHWSGRLGYGAGPIDVSVDYGATKTQTSDDYKVFGMAGSYNFGMAALYGFYNQNKWGGAKQNSYELSVGVPIGAGQFRASYGHQTTSGSIRDGSSRMYGLEYVYNLSKMTSLYTSYGRISNTGLSGYVVEGNGHSAVGDVSSGYNAGIKVSF